VWSDHPLRRVAAAIDFGFVRDAVAHCYGSKGNVSVDPEVIMKMMFLLFFDDLASERELMKIITARLDHVWFLGYGLEDEIPNHSVLSEAPARSCPEVFERLFVQTIGQGVIRGQVT
jgi:transposase